MAVNERVLTEEEKEEIVLTYIESMIFPEKYGGHRVRQKDLAEKYGVNQSTISKIVTSSDEVNRLNKRMQTRTMVAQSMAQLAAPKVMEATIKDALKERRYGCYRTRSGVTFQLSGTKLYITTG